MKKFIGNIIFICFCCSAFGQIPPPPPPPSSSDPNEIRDNIALEELAEFPGGDQGLVKFIQSNVKYPQKEKENGIQGKVFIAFVIERDGSISNVNVMKGVSGGAGCDSEGVRVIRMMPNWKPAVQDGKNVRVRYVIPINFKLGDSTPTVKKNDIPAFPGGQPDLDNYISSNLKYPKKAIKKRIEGLVSVSFQIDPSGNIIDPKIESSTDKIFNEEALRLIKEMPKWTPGKDQKTSCSEMVTVNFKLPVKK